MAKMEMLLPLDLINELEKLEVNTEKMAGDMTRNAAKIVYENVRSNMKNSFQNTSRLEKNLKITKTYKTPSDDGINTKVGFYGYLEGTEGKKVSFTKKTSSGKRTKKYTYNNGIPAPLVALAREYGTSRGEKAKPFFRKSFKKNEITEAMLKTQEKYLPKE